MPLKSTFRYDKLIRNHDESHKYIKKNVHQLNDDVDEIRGLPQRFFLPSKIKSLIFFIRTYNDISRTTSAHIFDDRKNIT